MDKPNKPLKDWTLEELKDYCDGRDCECDCLFFRADRCMIDEYTPCNWDLTERPKYTADEITLAKLLAGIGGTQMKKVDVLRGMEILIDYNIDEGRVRGSLPAAAFPSLPFGEWTDLKDIAESEVAP